MGICTAKFFAFNPIIEKNNIIRNVEILLLVLLAKVSLKKNNIAKRLSNNKKYIVINTGKITTVSMLNPDFANPIIKGKTTQPYDKLRTSIRNILKERINNFKG
jgi:hypothetical protein